MHASTANPSTAAGDPTRPACVKRRVRSFRHAMRSHLSTWLTYVRGTREPCGEPLAAAPTSILVCRVNKRLGNTLFVTPLLRALSASFPRASIDVLVLNPAHGRLLADLPGVREVICVPLSLHRFPAFVLRLRRRRYDLAIDPSVNATSNRIAISLCRSRLKLGFASREQWVRLTHAARIPRDESHQARQAVRLLHEGIQGTEHHAFERLEVRPGREARVNASQRLAAALDDPGRGPVLGFFTNASGNKQFPAHWWREWVEAIRSHANAPQLLQVLPPGVNEALLPDVPALSIPEPDRLAALLAAFNAFVAADSGPMHLAAAADTPTIGLFRATSPQDYAPLGRDCVALGPERLTAGYVAEYTLRHLQRIRAEPYPPMLVSGSVNVNAGLSGG